MVLGERDIRQGRRVAPHSFTSSLAGRKVRQSGDEFPKYHVLESHACSRSKGCQDGDGVDDVLGCSSIGEDSLYVQAH